MGENYFTITCLYKNGTLYIDGNLDGCEDNYCLAPKFEIPHAEYWESNSTQINANASFKHESTIIYKCEEGYLYNGDKEFITLKCNASDAAHGNGNWTPTQVECKRMLA